MKKGSWCRLHESLLVPNTFSNLMGPFQLLRVGLHWSHIYHYYRERKIKKVKFIETIRNDVDMLSASGASHPLWDKLGTRKWSNSEASFVSEDTKLFRYLWLGVIRSALSRIEWTFSVPRLPKLFYLFHSMMSQYFYEIALNNLYRVGSKIYKSYGINSLAHYFIRGPNHVHWESTQRLLNYIHEYSKCTK